MKMKIALINNSYCCVLLLLSLSFGISESSLRRHPKMGALCWANSSSCTHTHIHTHTHTHTTVGSV